jgi:3-oxoacyl-[acyl-carrier protein] reductase
MDLGIKGRWAIVCASSKGLGLGCAQALAAEGVNLVMNARSADVLATEAKNIRERFGVQVKEVAADVTTAQGRERLLAAAPQVDILINNAGGPPPGDFRTFTRENWLAAIDANMLTPIELIKATLDGMVARKFGRIINITSAAVKAPIEILALSNGARTGLTGFVAGIARQGVASNVTINNLLPGIFMTDRVTNTTIAAAKQQGKTFDEVLDARRQGIPAKRFGNKEEFGATCAFLCSEHASYFTGQNFLIDGGQFPGTF